MSCNKSLKKFHGRVLDHRFRLESPDINNLVDDLMISYISDYVTSNIKNNGKVGKRISRDKHKLAMHTVISCLYREWVNQKSRSRRCVRYYRSKVYYTGVGCSYSVYKHVINWLCEHDYIVDDIGYYNVKTGNSRMSRIRWSTTLSKRFRSVNVDQSSFFKNSPSIVVRDVKKRSMIDDDATLELFSYIEDDALDKQRVVNSVRCQSHVKYKSQDYKKNATWCCSSTNSFQDDSQRRI